MLAAWTSVRRSRCSSPCCSGSPSGPSSACSSPGAARPGTTRRSASARWSPAPPTTPSSARASTGCTTRCATSSSTASPGRASCASRSTTCGTPPSRCVARRSRSPPRCADRRCGAAGASCTCAARSRSPGMVARCDFDEQVSVRTDDPSTGSGQRALLRPDLVVNLAGGKHVVVDAKVPLDAFLDATSADLDDERDGASRAARPPAASARRRAGRQGLLAQPAGDARVRRALRARRVLPVRGARGRAGADRVRRREAGRARHPDDPDRAAAHGRLRLDPGVAGRQGPRDPRARPRAARPAGHDGRPPRQARAAH